MAGVGGVHSEWPDLSPQSVRGRGGSGLEGCLFHSVSRQPAVVGAHHPLFTSYFLAYLFLLTCNNNKHWYVLLAFHSKKIIGIEMESLEGKMRKTLQ